jgi:hypothetical protein
METVRLKAIQKPSRIERLLETMVTRAGLVPEGAYQLRDRSKLPSALEHVLIQTATGTRVWTCFTDGFRIWLFTGEMSLELSRERGAPVLTVNVYSESGDLQEANHWTTDRDGNWQRCVS